MFFNCKRIILSLLLVFNLQITAYSASIPSTSTDPLPPLTTAQLSAVIDQSDFNPDFEISATPDILDQINKIRANSNTRSVMLTSFSLMKPYLAHIYKTFSENDIPFEFSTTPLIESGYQIPTTTNNSMSPAGIWQFIPSTARQLGLTVNTNRDERLIPELETIAAVNYLNTLYAIFHNWNLVLIAYKLGDGGTLKLIQTVGSHNAWVLARSNAAPADLLPYMIHFDVLVILIHNPSLLG
ncbi:MAG: transglycosylase SLT domain-containing protein [Gammaproteobacteria bacterium]|nr:transglycosylase SLT domain-containing protein [Gammaproteobacteria bacterium]